MYIQISEYNDKADLSVAHRRAGAEQHPRALSAEAEGTFAAVTDKHPGHRI